MAKVRRSADSTTPGAPPARPSTPAATAGRVAAAPRGSQTGARGVAAPGVPSVPSHPSQSAPATAGDGSTSERWTEPPPRGDLARVLLAAIPAAERRVVYRSLRDFLRALHGAYVVGAWSDAMGEAFDGGSAAQWRKEAANAVAGFAETLATLPQCHAVAALCALVMGADYSRLAATIGEDDAANECRRARRALRILRAAYTSAREGAR